MAFEDSVVTFFTDAADLLGVPKSVDRTGVDAVVEPPGVLAGSEDEPSAELVAEEFAQKSEPDKIHCGGLRSRFDFESDDAAVVGLDEHVDFVAVVGAPLCDFTDVIVPGRLLE